MSTWGRSVFVEVRGIQHMKENMMMEVLLRVAAVEQRLLRENKYLCWNHEAWVRHNHLRFHCRRKKNLRTLEHLLTNRNGQRTHRRESFTRTRISKQREGSSTQLNSEGFLRKYEQYSYTKQGEFNNLIINRVSTMKESNSTASFQYMFVSC